MNSATGGHQWFKEGMFDFGGDNVYYLPEDHHMFMAMCAPRALYVTGNTDYEWLSNPSCYVCSRAVQQIYSTLGIADRFGFGIDGGHTHCAFPSGFNADLNYFLDKFMKGQTSLIRNVQVYPGRSSNSQEKRIIQQDRLYSASAGNPGDVNDDAFLITLYCLFFNLSVKGCYGLKRV